MTVLSRLSHLRRYNRLKANYSFSKVMQKGQMIKGHYLNCYIMPKKYGSLRLGVTCAKQTPSAVMRNYYKRRLRLAYQANGELIKSLKLGPIDCVLLAKHLSKKVSVQDYCDDLAAILQNPSLHAKINR